MNVAKATDDGLIIGGGHLRGQGMKDTQVYYDACVLQGFEKAVKLASRMRSHNRNFSFIELFIRLGS